ncbi:type II secretion system minor pseudopilin GspK [Erwinia sp. E_sp_B01_9]|uniref:type II secretion system minor pseudopilin GspK n=3 Tax=Erwinia TaxID=551 RepID=UPI003D9AC2D9
MALLMVLLMIATLATIVVATQEQWFHVFSRSRTLQQQLKDKWLLLSAESVMVHHYSALLSAPVMAPSLAGRQPDLQSDGHTFTVVIRDLQACFNLNSLFYLAEKKEAREKERRGGAGCRPAPRPFPEQIFLRLLIATGSDETVAEQILSEIKESAQISGRMFADISELRAMKSLNRQQWQALAGQLCALPDTRLRINVNGLQPSQALLLSALLNLPLSAEEVKNLLDTRPKAGWATLEALKKGQSPQGVGAQMVKAQAYLALNTEFFEIKIERHGRQLYPLRSWVRRSEEKFNVFRRQFGMSD